jgi:DamX protein
MSSQAHATAYNASQSVTSISANARVDYILRFSKHAVLVVDQDENVYSQVASQFLGSLADDHNAAFIAISPKLNDIQIRCRIIEQLFVDTLFDPEQSIAVSLINLAKQEKQAIDIVIEHAQFLSVQILHELCQLTDIAKKANYQISVLMLGTPQTGMELANHKSLFQNKISILSGQTGQLLTLNAKAFKASQSFFKLTRFTKWVMAFILFVICLSFMGFWLFQQDAFSLQTKLSLEEATPNTTSLNSVYKQKTITESAETKDILFSLTAQEQQAKVIRVQPAEPADIVNAIVSFEQKTTEFIDSTKQKDYNRFQSNLDEIQLKDNEVTSNVHSDNSKLSAEESQADVALIDNMTTDVNYYQNLKTGFVIQLAGFTELAVNQEDLPNFEGIRTKSYYRLYNQQNMLMITSEVYQTHLAAEQAIAILPSTIKAQQPWIKSVEAINSEINAYQLSQ